jgi:hypothetical protein
VEALLMLETVLVTEIVPLQMVTVQAQATVSLGEKVMATVMLMDLETMGILGAMVLGLVALGLGEMVGVR